MKALKLLPTWITCMCLRVVFRLIALLFPVNREKVTFASYRSNKLKDNLVYVYNEWARRETTSKFVFLLKPYRPGVLGKLSYLLHMIRACYHLATSRFFIVDDYYFPIYAIRPRKKTDIVQLWHAAGAFKKFGYSTVNKSFGPSEAYLKIVKVHSNYSKVFVSGAKVIPFYAEAFNMPAERILPLGVPRTDFFYDKLGIEKLKDRFYQSYPELKGKELVLYAPTFRGKSHEQGVFQCPFDLDELRQRVGSKSVLLVHLHPYMRSGMNLSPDLNNFVYLIEEGYNIQELLALSDRLITDYSSIIFDFSLLNRPMAFYADDLEAYELERGFYYDFRSFIPGPLVTKTEALANWLEDEEPDLEKVQVFKTNFFDYDDGQTSRRIVDYLLSIK